MFRMALKRRKDRQFCVLIIQVCCLEDYIDRKSRCGTRPRYSEALLLFGEGRGSTFHGCEAPARTFFANFYGSQNISGYEPLICGP